jgi:hypothetical protein
MVTFTSGGLPAKPPARSGLAKTVDPRQFFDEYHGHCYHDPASVSAPCSQPLPPVPALSGRRGLLMLALVLAAILRRRPCTAAQEKCLCADTFGRDFFRPWRGSGAVGGRFSHG